MAFQQPHTANLTPHPVPDAPSADQSSGREGSVTVEQASAARFPLQLGGRGGASRANIPKQIQHI